MSYFILDAKTREIRGLQTADVWAEIAPLSLADLGRSPQQKELLVSRGGLHRLVMPAGELESGQDEDAIEHAFRSWGCDGKAALDTGLRAAAEHCDRRGIELIVWPRLNSIVSDIPGLLSVARGHERVGILLEPAALFPAGAGVRIEDFATRLKELVALPSVRVICLGSEAGAQEEVVVPWLRLAETARQLGKPIVLRGEKPEKLAAALGRC